MNGIPVVKGFIVDVDGIGVELFIEELIEKMVVFLANAHEKFLMNFFRLVPEIVPSVVRLTYGIR